MEDGTPKLPSAGDIVGGKYRVERVIGRGGMGTVLAVRHLGLDEARALKLMLPRGMELPQARERFFREARAAAKLRSENAVAVHDVGVLPDGFPYIEMELLEGADLSQVLKRGGGIPIATAVDWIAQACEPVGEAHAIGIVHRDIKPGNLFLARSASGRELIKVLDFGIAKTVSVDTDPSLTGTNASFGSPMYMSPEQMRGARFADPRSDIWALGVVLFELLTGRRPFVSDSVTALALIVTSDPAPHPMSIRSDVPLEVDAIVMRCLEKLPERRFASAAELGAALRSSIAAPGAVSMRGSVASQTGLLAPAPVRAPSFSGVVMPPSSPSSPSHPAHASQPFQQSQPLQQFQPSQVSQPSQTSGPISGPVGFGAPHPALAPGAASSSPVLASSQPSQVSGPYLGMSVASPPSSPSLDPSDPSRPSIGAPTTAPSQPSVGTLSTTLGGRTGKPPVLLVGGLAGATVIAILAAFVAWRATSTGSTSSASATPSASYLAPPPVTAAAASAPSPAPAEPVASTEPARSPEAPAGPSVAAASASGPPSPGSAARPAAATGGGSRPGRPPERSKTGFGGID